MKFFFSSREDLFALARHLGMLAIQYNFLPVSKPAISLDTQ